MHLRFLRIDETMLPFMNGDGLEDVPTVIDAVSQKTGGSLRG